MPSVLRSVPCGYREMVDFVLKGSCVPTLSVDVKLMPGKSEKPLWLYVSIGPNLWVHAGSAEA